MCKIASDHRGRVRTSSMVMSKPFLVSWTMGIYATVFISLCYLPVQWYPKLPEFKGNWLYFQLLLPSSTNMDLNPNLLTFCIFKWESGTVSVTGKVRKHCSCLEKSHLNFLALTWLCHKILRNAFCHLMFGPQLSKEGWIWGGSDGAKTIRVRLPIQTHLQDRV